MAEDPNPARIDIGGTPIVDPSGVGGGFVDIRIIADDGDIDVIAIDDDVSAALVDAGEDPHSFNRVRWPVGADAIGTMRLLIHHKEIAQLEFGVTTPVVFCGIEFWMYPRNPVPVFISEGSGLLYALEFVDSRHFWNETTDPQNNDNTLLQVLRRAGFNITRTADKTTLYEASMATDDNGDTFRPYTIREAIQTLESEVGAPGIYMPADGSVLAQRLDDADWRDFQTSHAPVPELIDKLAMLAGGVVVAYPSPGYPAKAYDNEPAGTFFAMVAIGDGETTAGQMMTTYTDEIIGGGLYAPTDDYVGPGDGAGAIAAGMVGINVSAFQAEEVPDVVHVHFPIARVPGILPYDESEEAPRARSFTLGRTQRYESSDGRPAVFTLSQSKSFHATVYGIIDPPNDPEVPVNDAALQLRADHLSRIYYERFRSAPCDIRFRGCVPLKPWAGAQLLEWWVGTRGPFTRAVGRVAPRIFGFAVSKELRPADLFGIGDVRALPRPDNGMTFDGRPPVPSRVFYGKITAVFGAGGGAPSYDAESYDDDTIAVVAQQPIRQIPTPQVDVVAAAVNDPCFICVRGDPHDGATDLYALTERPLVVDCEDVEAAAGTVSGAEMLSAFGDRG